MNNKKRVLILGSYPAPYRVAVFKGLAGYFDADVFFATDRNENRNKDWFCKNDDFSFAVLEYPDAVALFRERLRHINDYDFVIAYDALSKAALKTIFMCRIKRIPYFVNCDGAFLEKCSFLKKHIKQFVFCGAVRCFSSGQHATEYYKSYGVNPDKVVEHPFTSLHQQDILNEPVSETEKKNIKDNLGLTQKTTVLSIGQFIPRKGFDILIEAWKDIGSKAELLIIGGGDERARYESYIQENKIEGISLLDFMPKEKLSDYYKASNFFVLPTREDIWGLVINEAMANGLPVITTDRCIAGLELIKDGQNGYIVKVENVNDLRDRINDLLDNPKIIESMGVANISKIQHWTIENVVKSHIETIRQTIEK